MSQNYNPDKNRYLIGPVYFSNYKTVLFIVLLSTLSGMLVSGLVSMVSGDSGGLWIVAFGKWFGMSLMGLISSFGFVTLLFALFERKGIEADFPKSGLDDLPAVPKKQESIGKWEPIVGIVFSSLFLIIFLVVPQIFCIIFTKENLLIPIFNISVLYSVWYFIIGLFMLGIIREVFKIYEGRYTKKLALVTLITNVFSLLLTYLFIFTDELINPELISYTANILGSGEDMSFLTSLFTHLPSFFFAVVSFALLLDVITTAVKSFFYDR